MSSFVLVLHGHLPWVVHHGRWPHGEEWLHEAVAETWLPLLDALDEVHERGARAPITVGLTPVLLEQLRHARFQDRFVPWLDARIERAQRDEDEFAGWGDAQLAGVARLWQERMAHLKKRFVELDGDIASAFGRLWSEGRIEVMGSERLTGALLDRLTHRVHILEANGQSYRLQDSKRRQASRKKKA